MTIRATARHRAPVRRTTPLSAITSAMTDHVGNLGRGGVVLAMSSGLVATMGLPAQAIERATGPEAAAPATAPIAVQPALALQAGLIASPATVNASAAPLTAPATATVRFESSAFTAVPRKVVAVHGSITTTASQSTVTGSFSGSAVLAIAARYLGVPYRYGGTTPLGWDCSGSMDYIFRQVGVFLPRTANDQMLATKRISASQARAGDLVFFISGGRAYHVGLVAGGGMMYDAQRTGKTFTKRAIYSSAVVYGRIG